MIYFLETLWLVNEQPKFTVIRYVFPSDCIFLKEGILKDYCFYIVMHEKGKKGRYYENEKERFLPAIYRLSPLSSVAQHMQK